MKERPILFNADMVRAILEGRKTQTRRVVKFPHMNSLGVWEPMTFGGPSGGCMKNGQFVPEQDGIWHTRTGDCLACPYGGPGDQLWVRETCRAEELKDGTDSVRYLADNAFIDILDSAPSAEKWHDLASYGMKTSGLPECRVVPSIHMPRWASRIQLEITDVRVERLQDISEADSIAEGVDGQMAAAAVGKAPSRHELLPAAVHGYAHLWESINGPGSWAANPFVWVVEFRRIKP